MNLIRLTVVSIPGLLLAALITLAVDSPVLAQNQVQCNVAVDVPSVVKLSGVDNVTTTQNLTLNQSNISFDTELNATGEVSVLWKGNTNSNKGFEVTVQRSGIAGNASQELRGDLTLQGYSEAGGDTTAVVAPSYSSGVRLMDVPEGKPEQFLRTQAPGSANFRVKLRLDAPSSHGQGRVSTVLTFVAASL